MNPTTKKRLATIAAVAAIYGVLSYSGQVPTIPELVTSPDVSVSTTPTADSPAQTPDHMNQPVDAPVSSDVITGPDLMDTEPPAQVLMPPPGM